LDEFKLGEYGIELGKVEGQEELLKIMMKSWGRGRLNFSKP